MKEVTLGGGAYPGDARTVEGPPDTGTGSITVAYRDNLSGAIYTDSSACVNGCTQLVGDAADEAITAAQGLADEKAAVPTANKAKDKSANKGRR